LISLHAVARFNIATKFSVGQTASFAEIARLCEIDLDTTRRILRRAITNHVFFEPEFEVIAHTSISKALAKVPNLREWVTVAWEDTWPPTTKAVSAMIKWPNSSDSAETAYNLVTGAQGSFFQELSASPERVEDFTKAMSLFKLMPGFEPNLVTEAKLWESVDEIVVDVGGTDGAVAKELSAKFPKLRIVVQDLPEVIENAKNMATTETSSQITFNHTIFSPSNQFVEQMFTISL
jgi:hypothetical protein